MTETLKKMEEFSKQGTHLQGLTTGFKDLDKLFSGLRAGDLIVLAARPGLGKTAFALNVAVNAAKAGGAVAFFSLEMPSEQLIQRVVCTEGKVNLKNIRSGSVHNADWPKIIKAGNTLSKCDFWIDDSSALTVTELRAKARRQLRGKKDGLIVVDYLQLMESGYRQNKDRHLEVAEFTRGLKLLAKDLKVPIIVLSQLNRQSENSKDRRPQLFNLRESGAIEQDADIVMFIDRYYEN
jgi:replicative DNA helicase